MHRQPLLVFVAVASVAVMSSSCGEGSTPTSATPRPPMLTYTVSGTVATASASGMTPIVGATVRELRQRLSAVTDRDGRYSIAGITAGDSAIQVESPGFVTHTSTVAVGGDVELNFRIEPIAMYTLSGIVYEVADGRRVPVEGVELYCDSCGSPVGHTYAYTDAHGFYSFGWSQNGVHRLLVRKGGYRLANPIPFEVPGFQAINATVNGDTRFEFEIVRQ